MDISYASEGFLKQLKKNRWNGLIILPRVTQIYLEADACIPFIFSHRDIF
jgi:hypothetical protein